MRDWPSIVPAAAEDSTSSSIAWPHGTAFAETDLDRADYETTITDLMTGQHCDPLRVIMFNPETNRSEDVSHVIAQEILRRLGLEGRDVPSVLEDFIDRHVGPDRQLTLRLALARSIGGNHCLGRAGSIKKSSSPLPACICGSSHRGRFPRPDQTSAGLIGFRYFGGTGG